MEYNFNISFTDEQLANIFKSCSNVIIAKQGADGSTNVAWQVFKPMSSNSVTWAEKYGIYASNAELKHGAKLTQLSNVPVGAASNKLYTLEASGIISGPLSGGKANSFALLNAYAFQPLLTVGLYQDATVNGTAILGNACSAAPVLLQSTAVMTPYTTISIWLQSEVESNTVVTTVTSPLSLFKFGGDITTISVVYDDANGCFAKSA